MANMADSKNSQEQTENLPGETERSSLQEVMRRGRQLRSGHKEGQLIGLYGGLTKEDFDKQPEGVGLVYDERMLKHFCLWEPEHPEKPERLSLPIDRCNHYKLIERCQRIEARLATEQEVLLCHSEEYLSTLKQSEGLSEEELKELSSRYDGVHINQNTYECSLLALGGTIEVVDSVCKGEVRHGMALVRPPGHHAMYDEACGYCFVNNVAVAAKHALQSHKLQRILIIDWDVHHGQGTQYAFYNDPRVIYFSIHRYEHGDFWPNLRQSDYDKIGEGEGTGYNVNVPLNKTQMTNGDYMAIFTQILLPIAYEFNPQLVLVSAGYDSAIGCPEGENLVSPALFAHLVTLLKPLANGKLALVLEGGYCLKSLAESVALSLRALLGDPCPDIFPIEEPCESVVASILHVLQCLRPYWRSLVYQGISEDDPEIWSRHKCQKEITFSNKENQPAKHEIYGDYLSHTKEKEREMDREVQTVIDETIIESAPNRTCVVYDEAMRKHKCTSVGAHPERPDRIRVIYDKHHECGLIKRCKELPSRNATDKELLLVHTSQHLNLVKSFTEIPLTDLHDMERSFNSVYLSQEAYECSNLAVGCTLQVVDDVCLGKSQNGLAIVRPPGHHAEPGFPCGFCYFNTAAIAAKYAQRKHNLRRVLILDWDVHHGNGTQHMFWTDPSVLYISLHRYDDGFFFPCGDDGNYNRVGAKRGEGYNVNIPWNTKCGDAEYIAAFQQIVLPIAYEYGPQLVIVSAGFDAARGDPLGGFKITPEGYAHMTSMLTTLAGGKVIMALEGGYNLHSISESMVMCTSMLLGDNCPALPAASMVPREGAIRTICNVQETHSRYWKSLQFAVDLPLTPQQKEDMLAVHAALSPSDGVTHITKSINSLAIASLPDAEPTYSSDSSSSSTEDMADTKPQTITEDAQPQADSIQPQAEGIKSQAEDAQPQAEGIKSQAEDAQPQAEGIKSQAEDAQPQAEGIKSQAEDAQPQAQDSEDCMRSGSEGDGVVVKKKEGIKGAQMDHNESMAKVGEEEGATGGSSIDQDGVQMFTVVPRSWCPHLETGIKPLPSRGLVVNDACIECQHKGECWVCLTCYEVHCGRYINEHMLFHGLETEHPLVLSYADLSAWCYPCESYVHHPDMTPAKRSAHVSKFGHEPSGI